MWIGLVLLVIIIILSGLAYAGLRANEADWGNLHSNIIDGLLRLFCRNYHRLHFAPIPLPATGPAIIAANHISGLDPFLIFAACKRPVHFMIASDQYYRFGLTWLFRLAGCIPLEMNGRNDGAVRSALKALQEGKVLALFPQGGIHREHEPRVRLKRGVHKLAEVSKAPVFPVRLSNIRGAGHVVKGVILRSRARLESFPPIECATMDHHACLATLAGHLQIQTHATA